MLGFCCFFLLMIISKVSAREFSPLMVQMREHAFGYRINHRMPFLNRGYLLYRRTSLHAMFYAWVTSGPFCERFYENWPQKKIAYIAKLT